jgi:hypothetical protein
MENGQPTKTGSESERKAVTSGASISLPLSESTEGNALMNSRKSTTATTLKGSLKTWTSAELAVLRSKVGIVAGAIADFQTAKGRIVRDEVIYTAPSGRVCKAIKLILLVEDVDLVAVKTGDGTDFNIVAGSGT